MAAAVPPNLSPSARRVVALLLEQAERARREILNPPGRSESAKAFNATRSAQRLAGIRRELKALKAAMPRVVGEEIGRAYRAGLVAGDAMAAAAGVRGGAIQGGFTVIDRRRAEVLMQDAVGDLAKAADSIIRVADRRRAEVLMQDAVGDLVKAADSIIRVADRTLRQIHALGLNDQDVNRLLAGGTIEGKPRDTLRELRRQVRRAANGGLVEVVNPRTGLVTTHDAKRYADLVFQTKTREATVVATAGRLQDSGVDLVRIIGSNSANFCTAFVGKVYSLSGTHPVYPPFAELPRGGPPFHPRCSKTIVAFVEQLASPAQLEKAGPDDSTRELMGATPAIAQRAYRQRR